MFQTKTKYLRSKICVKTFRHLMCFRSMLLVYTIYIVFTTWTESVFARCWLAMTLNCHSTCSIYDLRFIRCQSGYGDKLEEICLFLSGSAGKLGSSCLANNRCTDPNTICISGTCQCQTSFYAVNGVCSKLKSLTVLCDRLSVKTREGHWQQHDAKAVLRAKLNF